jgi:glycolate oxidase FAD binding subunit
VLADASRAGQRTVLRGGATKLGWGSVPSSVDLLIETGGLDQLVAHRYGDMTATVQAGMPLALLNARLAEHGQCLPVDSAFDAATVGGVIATNDAGPLRHRFGTPRDLLIGITLALTDGRLVKSGGTVVKNVAGYDLGKLVSGSHGSYAAIVDATFKLLPVPPASSTLLATYAITDALARDVAGLSASQVELTSFDIRVTSYAGLQLLLRTASSPAGVEAQASAAARLLSSPATRMSGEDERSLWAEQIRLPWAGGGTVVRFSWLPAKLPAVLSLLERLRRSDGRLTVFAGRTMGAGLARFDGDEGACRAAIAELRASPDLGHVVVLRATRSLKTQLDVWGPPAASAPMARSLKGMFDPAGILNAGRGPI